MKRLLTLFVAAVALLLTPFSVSLAQTAADMRLAAYTGTVSVTDAGGSLLQAQDGMRLFDGYGVNTGVKSYAWVSLDQTKALKLDALSSVKINKAGRKLKIGLLSGKLLCDVSAPLDDSESLEIRTSTTVTGIRGTVLVVRVIDEFTTVIYVLEGQVTVTETDPETGETRMITVAAGQMATSTTRSASGGGEGNDVTLRSFTADEVDDFVLDEIERNSDFVEHLRSTDSVEVQKLLDQKEPEEADDPPAGESEDAGPTYVDLTITSTGDPAQSIPEEFMDALADNTYLNLTVSEVTDLRPGQDVAVATTQTVNLNDTNMDMQTNDLNNAGTINVDAASELACAGTLTNSSANTLNVYGSLFIDGSLVNTGVINIYGVARVLHLNNMGVLNILEDGRLDVHGIDDGDGAPDLGSLENTGEINVDGTLDIDYIESVSNQKDITISQNGEFSTTSDIVNTGSITNSGSLINVETLIDNQGTLINDGTITNYGWIENSGTIDNDGAITNDFKIENDGTIDNDGTIENNGTIENRGVINGTGTITGNPVETMEP